MRRRRKRKRIFLPIIILLLIAVIYRCSVDEKPQTPSHNYFDDLPKNTYNQEKFYEQNGFICYENGMIGIDVSAHQDEIDWQQVKQAGVDFAIIRVAYRGYTNGSLSEDPCFVQNMQGAKDAGLQVGAYLFSQAVTVAEAEEEADFLLQCLDGMTLDLPVYFDWETIEAEARTNEISGRDATDFAIAFCQKVEAAGYRAGIYFNESMGYMFFRLPELKQYDFWLAQYQQRPDFYYDFHVWQYSQNGTVAGIDSQVDLNICFAK